MGVFLSQPRIIENFADFYSVLLKSRGLGVFLYLSACAPSPSALEFINNTFAPPTHKFSSFFVEVGGLDFFVLERVCSY